MAAAHQIFRLASASSDNRNVERQKSIRNSGKLQNVLPGAGLAAAGSLSSQASGISNFCDRLPDFDQRLHSGRLDRLVVSSSTSWQPRMVVLTSEHLMIAKFGADVVLDSIPLDQIEKVRWTGSDDQGPVSSGDKGKPVSRSAQHSPAVSPKGGQRPPAIQMSSWASVHGMSVAGMPGIGNPGSMGGSRSGHNHDSSGLRSLGSLGPMNSPMASKKGPKAVERQRHSEDFNEGSLCSSRRSSNLGLRPAPNGRDYDEESIGKLSNKNWSYISMHEGIEKDNGFTVYVKEGSHTRYYMKALTKGECAEWIDAIILAKADYLKMLDENTVLTKKQKYWAKLRSYQDFWWDKYYSSAFQIFIYSVILSSFVTSVLQAEERPVEGSSMAKALDRMEIFYTVTFTLELLLNLFINFRDREDIVALFSDGWIYLDIFVVLISLLTEALDNLPGVTFIRLLRVFRIVKVFRFLTSLRRLIDSLAAAVTPVVQSCGLVLIVTAIYAILCTNLFHERSPQYFSHFSMAMFTLLQMSYGDNFGQITRSLWECPTETPDCAEDDLREMDQLPTWMLVSYMFISCTVLMNIVVTVLLDAFIGAVEREKRESWAAIEQREKEEIPALHPGPLEPLMESMCFFRSPEDLENFISELFSVIDEDESGEVDFRELQVGLGRLKLGKPINLSAEDWEMLTAKQPLSRHAALSKAGFRVVIHQELVQFVYRRILGVMNHAGSSDFEILMVLKMLLSEKSFALPQNNAEPGISNADGGGASGSTSVAAASQGEPISSEIQSEPTSPTGYRHRAASLRSMSFNKALSIKPSKPPGLNGLEMKVSSIASKTPMQSQQQGRVENEQKQKQKFVDDLMSRINGLKDLIETNQEQFLALSTATEPSEKDLGDAVKRTLQNTVSLREIEVENQVLYPQGTAESIFGLQRIVSGAQYVPNEENVAEGIVAQESMPIGWERRNSDSPKFGEVGLAQEADDGAASVFDNGHTPTLT